MLKGKTIVELAVDLAAGTITEALIKEELGEGVLNSVLSIGSGILVGGLTAYSLNSLEKHTGVVSDIGSLVDDVINIFD